MISTSRQSSKQPNILTMDDGLPGNVSQKDIYHTTPTNPNGYQDVDKERPTVQDLALTVSIPSFSMSDPGLLADSMVQAPIEYAKRQLQLNKFSALISQQDNDAMRTHVETAITKSDKSQDVDYEVSETGSTGLTFRNIRPPSLSISSKSASELTVTSARPDAVEQAERQMLKNKRSTFVCIECHENFGGLYAYSQHCKKYHSGTLFCEPCRKHFKTESGYVRHYGKVHYKFELHPKHRCHNYNRATLPCDLCTKNFETYFALHLHCKEYHSGKAFCKPCQKLYLSAFGYNRHFRYRHRDCWIRQCNLCGKSFEASMKGYKL